MMEMVTKGGPSRVVLGALAAGLAMTSLATAQDYKNVDAYYKKTPQFHSWPDPGGARYKIKRFGPVGIGLELRQPAFTMHIVNVEEGSPAAASGARITTHLLHELGRRGGGFGLGSACIGGGQGIAIVVEV